MHIDCFDWIHDSNEMLWLSTTAGAGLCSYRLSTSSKQLEKIEPAAAFECLPSWNPCTGRAVYPIESATDFMCLWDESTKRVTHLPMWCQQFEDVKAEVIEWDGPQVAKVSEGVYYSTCFSTL